MATKNKYGPYGANIRLCRKSRKVTQRELAKRIGIQPTYLSMIENGIYRPGLELLEKIAKELKTTVSELCKESK